MINPILLAAFSALTPPSVDATYVFTVPVRIENMRHVTDVRVQCSIVLVTSTGSTMATATPRDLPWITLRDGGLNETVTVSVVVPSSTLALATPTRWSCALMYRFRQPDGTIWWESVTDPRDRERAYTRLTGQEVTTATTEVRGELTPP